MKIYAYCRRSSDETDNQIYSLEAQKDVLIKHCREHNYPEPEYIAESHSAWAKTRPLWTKLLKQAASEAKKGETVIIIAHKVDRFTRNRRDYAFIDPCMTAGVRIEFVEGKFADNAAGKMTFGLFVLLAQYYSDNLSEEVKKGQVVSVKHGLYPGPWKTGYLSRPERHLPRIFNPDEAWKVKEVFEKIAAGEKTQDVLYWAQNVVKLKNHFGRTIVPSSFYKMIRDVFYTGKFEWGGKIHQGKHEALVPDKIFYRVQDILAGRTHIKDADHEYLFSGLLFDKTGNRFGVTTNKNRFGTAYKYYRNRVTGVQISEASLEKEFIHMLDTPPMMAMWQNDARTEAKRLLRSERGENADKRLKTIQEIQKLENRLIVMEEKLFDGIISNDRYSLLQKECIRQISDLKESIPADGSIQEEAISNFVVSFAEHCKSLSHSYISLSYTQKCKFIKRTMSNIFIDDEEIVLEPLKEVSAILDFRKLSTGIPVRNRT